MTLALLHRRLAIGMALAGLVAFGVGLGLTAVSPVVAGFVLLAALRWRPSAETSARLERVWLPVAFLLVLRALYHAVVVQGDVVVPVVDLLLLLLCAEALRALDSVNDVRLYALSFALLLASTAYRPGILFALAFIAYIVLATLALMVGHLRRKALSHGLEHVPVGRPVLGTTIALAGVTLLTAGIVFLTFPRVTRSWSGRGEVFATSVAGFSEQVSIGEFGSRIYPNPEIVLRVEFPGGQPSDYTSLHWRGRSYDHFDGVRWSRSDNVSPVVGNNRWYGDNWEAPVVEHRIFGAPLDTRVLFGTHPVIDIEPESQIQPLRDAAGDFFYWGSVPPSYTTFSLAERPSDEELRAAESGFMAIRSHFLQLPRLPDGISELADSIAGDLPTRFDKVAAIESWLRTEFDYTLELPGTAREATLEHFLFERRAGHCEYFSTAMAVMLRTLGIHARNVNGFLGGSWSTFGEYLAVTQNEAHSWVEVWFPDYGWVTFDPTPAGGDGSTAGGTSWFWPGRFLYDGIQHQWGKWILDYSMQNQSDVLGGLLAALRGGPETTAPSSDTSLDETTAPLWLIALVALLGGTGLMVLVRRRGGPVEVRWYVRLAESCRNAGLVEGQVAPLELVRALEHARSPASEPAARVVGHYVRARFGGQSLNETERSEMRDALKAALSALRRGGTEAPAGAQGIDTTRATA